MKQRRPVTFVLLLVILLAPAFAWAQDKQASTTPLPEWDQLSSTQRADLIAPLRDRWNSSPEERTRLYERAGGWKAMPADARQRAPHGMQRRENMSPPQRAQAQSLFHAMRGMDEGQRKDFLAKWHAMTPQQRIDWVSAHPAPQHRRRQEQE